jgi:hypothetical protein
MRLLAYVLAVVGLLICLSDRVPGQTQATTAVVGTKDVSFGAFNVKLPREWENFRAGEASGLRQQYLAQSKQIFRQFSGGRDNPNGPIGIAAFHIAGDDSAFILVSFAVPPQADLINLLKSQVKQKMDFGIRQGFVREYVGLVPIDDERFSGFYTKAIGKSGNVEVAGGLESKQLRNTVIQLTLLSPKAWDMDRATGTLAAILRSVSIGAKQSSGKKGGLD